MARTAYQSVDTYIAAQPEAVRPILARVRSVIRQALPGAEEVISYQIPAYRVHGRIALFFAGWKEHYSLYPIIGAVAAEFEDQLASYSRSKGTVRFSISEPVPAKLIAGIAKFRGKELAARQKSRPAAKKR